MADVHVLRLRRTDTPASAPPSYILLHVQKSGSQPLDAKLIATEREHLYHANVKQSSIKSLQSSHYSGDLNEWTAILQHALLQQQPVGVSSRALDGLETVAAISGESLTVTFRKNIGGIVQRLGSLKLTLDDEREEVAFPEWVDTAVSASDSLRDQLNTLQISVTEQQKQVTSLTQQLDDLVKAKKDHEEELLKKFAAMLNSKKLKIRDQQRLLAGVKIDASAVEEVRGPRNAGASRKGKRKADGATDDGVASGSAVVEDDGSATEDDDGDEIVAREETPQASDRDVSNNEDSDASGFEAAPVQSQASRRGVRRKGKALETSKQPVTASRSGPGVEHMSDDSDADVLPPKRDMPQRKGAAAAKKAESQRKPPVPAPAPTGEQDDDDETDDDEL